MKRLSDLGERKAITLIESLVAKGNAAVGIGDDCAAFELGDNYLLVTTDMITQKTHIPKGMTPFQIGWFAVAINLSDLAAKGGTPFGIVLALGLPKTSSEAFLRELMRGANACATQYDTTIVGGDTKENPEVTICGTAFGTVNKEEFMPRKGAKPGDIVAVTGSLGKAAAGYLALHHGRKQKEMWKGLLEPLPRIREGRVLAKQRVASSCIDISDGLSASLYQLQEMNSVGFEIEQEKIPVSSNLLRLKKQLNIDVYDYALHFGGDYELLITMSQDAIDQAKKAVQKTGNSLTVIGRVIKKREIRLRGEKTCCILENRGYEHFKTHNFFFNNDSCWA